MGSKVKVTGVKVILKIFNISKTPGPILTKLCVCIRLAPRIDPMGSKVTVIEVKVISKNLEYLGDPWPNFNQTWQVY